MSREILCNFCRHPLPPIIRRNHKLIVLGCSRNCKFARAHKCETPPKEIKRKKDTFPYKKEKLEDVVARDRVQQFLP